ncbi:MAG: hypothetical protein ABW088_05290 [Sedimenticola sp.]
MIISIPHAGGRGISDVLADRQKYTTATLKIIMIYQGHRWDRNGLVTFAVSSKFEIPYPGERVIELRNHDHEIVTVWDYSRNIDGTQVIMVLILVGRFLSPEFMQKVVI